VAPSAGFAVHDFDLGLLAEEFLHVPALPEELLARAAGFAANHLVADEQVDAGPAARPAAADEKIQKRPLDCE